MTHVALSFFVPYPIVFKQHLLQWLRQFACVAFYDSNNYKHDRYSTHDLIAGCANALVDLDDNPIAHVSRLAVEGNYLFGYFGYDLKNKIEKLYSEKPNHTGFADACFFKADIVFELKGTELQITTSGDARLLFEDITNVEVNENEKALLSRIDIKHRTPKEKYLESVESIRRDIEEGNFYELNYCQEFYCENAKINADVLFTKLCKQSAAPFSSYLKFHDLHIISSSPERFLKRLGGNIISQPIKGTIKRDLYNSANDEALKAELQDSEKEKAENVMIVDLVRNDLNRICKTSSVNVNELFGVHSFPSIHHMISTVTGKLRDGVTFEQIFKAMFPMGSMTGAPKVEVMKAIEFYEDTARGVYSGTIGYIKPNGDFDFNVIIRTLLYNAGSGYLSFHTGGAITFDSHPDAEYEECMLKAQAMTTVLLDHHIIEN